MDTKKVAEALMVKFQFDAKLEYNLRPLSVKGITRECALICLVNEYNALREQLFNLRSTRVIESEKVYLHRLDELIRQEQEVKEHLNNM